MVQSRAPSPSQWDGSCQAPSAPARQHHIYLQKEDNFASALIKGSLKNRNLLFFFLLSNPLAHSLVPSIFFHDRLLSSQPRQPQQFNHNHHTTLTLTCCLPFITTLQHCHITTLPHYNLATIFDYRPTTLPQTLYHLTYEIYRMWCIPKLFIICFYIE